MTQRKIDYWVIPPEADGEFVACMEEVLDTYAQPYDSRHPVRCMDEQPIQLLSVRKVNYTPGVGGFQRSGNQSSSWLSGVAGRLVNSCVR